jgi:diacylglycerol kinase (ATP)
MLVVVNPASAGGRTARRWPEIRRALDASGLRYTAHNSLGRGDAIELTRSAIRERGVRRVAAVGGDGTLNEVLNGCFDEQGRLLAAGLTLGVVSSGTGTDFRRALGIPTDPLTSAHLLGAATPRPVDVGCASFADGSHRAFLNVASCGISADVVARVERRRHRGVGRLRRATFLSAAVAALLTYRKRDVELTLDAASRRLRVEEVAVSNGPDYGGGMRIAPGARVDDGYFDVVVVGDISRPGALRAIPRLYRGTHVTHPAVTMLRAKRIRIAPVEGELAPLVETDGETAGAAPVEITLLPTALGILAPPG